MYVREQTVDRLRANGRQPSSRDSSTSFPLNGIDLASISDEQLILMGQTAPVIYSLWSTRIVRLSVNLILKFGKAIQMQEIEAMKCVLSKTTVLTPKLHRYFFTQSESTFDRCGYIVMDYVEGDTLFDIWNTISQEKCIDIFGQIASIVSQLQAADFEQPGPLGGGRCRGFWFTDYEAGPFNNREEFNAWFTHKLEISKQFGHAEKDLPPFDYTSFVLVHQDINPKNLVLDSGGKVWIIDWGNAGAYPAIFEAATMCESSRFPEFNALLLPHIYNNTAEREHLLGFIWGVLVAGYQ
jgi:serine/threonine protein kinase